MSASCQNAVYVGEHDEIFGQTSMAWPTPKTLPVARPDGVCVACSRKAADTIDGRYCAKCMRELVKDLSPGQTRRYHAERSERGRDSGTTILDRAERRENSDYWAWMHEGSRENAVKALEGD